MKRWNWKKCITVIVALALLVGLIPPVSAADEPLAFVTTSLPGSKIGAYYSYQLEVSGGAPEYRFSLLGSLPAGLRLSNDGLISGTPTENGYFQRVRVMVTDGEGSMITKTFSLRITATLVDFEVTDIEWDYDGNPHQATVVPKINGADVSDSVDFTVTYNGTSTLPTNAGTYRIGILAAPGFRVASQSADIFYIRSGTESSISLSDLQAVYDGNPHQPTVTVTPEGLRYTLTYTDTNGQTFSEAPTLPGSYTVHYRTTDPNYAVREGNATFTIEKLPLRFTAEDGSAVFAEGRELTLPGEVTAQLPEGCAIAMPQWHLEYDDQATEERETLLAAVNAGNYGVYPVFDDPADAALFDVPEGPIAEFTVEKLPVTFRVQNNVKIHHEDAQYALVTPNNVQKPEDVSFTVHYFRDGEEAEPRDVGVYDIRVVVDDENYCAANGGELGVTLTIAEAGKVPINIDNWQYTYDGQPHQVTATAVESSGYTGGMTVRYRDVQAPDSEPVSQVVNAGRYEIIVTLDDEDYEPGELGHRYLMIDPRQVTVTLESKTSVYSGEEVTPVILTDQGLTSDQYSYAVLMGDSPAALVDAGSYVVAVTLTDANYTISGSGRLAYTITPQPVTFALEDTSSEYNGGVVTPVILTTPEFAQEKYTVDVQKDGAPAVIQNAGTYDVKITVLDGNYSVSGGNLTYTVAKKPLTFLVDSTPAIMNDRPQEPTISVDPACLIGTDTVSMSECSVTYFLDGTPVQGLPVKAGTYGIHVKADLENYEADLDLTETFTILPKTGIQFTVEQPELVYTGAPQTVVVTPPADYTGEYTVQILDPSGTPVDAVTDAGTYTVTVTLTESTETPVLNSSTVKVLPQTVSFSLLSSETLYTGQAITPQLTADPASTMEHFTVTYRRGGAQVTEIRQYGDYMVEIASNNANYVVADGQASLPFTVRMPVGNAIYLEYGNTPAGLISKNLVAAERTSALEQFRADRLYHGVTYTGGAWVEGHDADLDPSAVVVTRISDFTEPGFVAYNAVGVPKEESSVSIAISGEYISATTGESHTLESMPLNDGLQALVEADACLGVFTITYTSGIVDIAAGRNIATRQLILLPKLGDANLDGSVNGADATYLLAQRSLGDDVSQALKQLHEYRVCDAAHVGWDTEDAWNQAGAAVLNRFVTPLAPFYQ